MEKNLKWVLDRLGVDIKELARIINEEGGRDPYRPIIYPERCDNKSCNNQFFSNSQDHNMRINNGYPTLCPSCREIDRKEKKRRYAKNRVKKVKGN